MNKVAILGSSSFFGKSLIDEYLTKGNLVLGLCRTSPDNPIMTSYLRNKNVSNLQIFEADLKLNIEGIIQRLRDFKPDYVIDAAGQGMVVESWEQPHNWFETNLSQKSKLLKALMSFEFLKKYIKISTPEVYGSYSNKLKTTHSYNPSTPYAISHAAIDMLLQSYFKEFNFPMVIARFANFYGPEQQLYRIVPKSIISCLKSEKLGLHGGGISKRSFIYKSDFVSAVELLVKNSEIGKVYHFSDDSLLSIKEIVEIVCVLLNKNYDEFVFDVPERPGKDFKYDLDISESASIGWRPTTGIREGIENTIHWITEYQDAILKMDLSYRYKP